MKQKIVFIIVLAILLLSIGYIAVLNGPQGKAEAKTQVTICHKNNGNGWSQITVDWDAVDGSGGGDHNSSGHQGGQDIIPSGFWDSNGRNWDTEGQAIWNNNCNVPVSTPTPTVRPTSTPMPTATPTVKPTNTPVPTATVEPTATPTEEPKCDDECVTATPTPTTQVTPTPTEQVTPTPTVEQPQADTTNHNSARQGGDGSAGSPPGPCTDSIPSTVASINVKSTGIKGELEVQWALPLGADKVHIQYGLEKIAQYALLNTPNDGNEIIRGLTSGNHYWFSVAGVNGCAVGNYSNWFDPIVL
jgi:hypothetical protein